MTARHEAPTERAPGDLLVRVGAVVFVVGLVGIVLILVPYLSGHRDDSPTSLDLVALLMPLGFGLALVGLLRGARHHPPLD